MNLNEVLAAATSAAVPASHIERIKMRLENEANLAVPIMVQQGLALGVATGREYRTTFDVVFICWLGNTNVIVWQSND